MDAVAEGVGAAAGAGDDDERGEAFVDLGGGAHVRVGVVPVGAGAVDDGEVADEFLILADSEARVAVGIFGDIETVPVDDGRFAEVVAEADADVLAAAEAEDWAEVGIGEGLEGRGGAFDDLAGEAPDLGRVAGENGDFGWCGGEFEFDVGFAAGFGGSGGEGAGGHAGERQEGEEAAAVGHGGLRRRVGQKVVGWPMRRREPSGSTMASSCMPHGLRESGSMRGMPWAGRVAEECAETKAGRVMSPARREEGELGAAVDQRALMMPCMRRQWPGNVQRYG